MIEYRHQRTGIVVTRDKNAGAFRHNAPGNKYVQIPNEIVENSLEWVRVFPEVLSYPAELVEPLFNCRLENVDKYIDNLMAYKEKIQNS